MNVKEIERFKNEMNTWYVGPLEEDFFDTFRHYVEDYLDGVDSVEAMSVIGSGLVVESFGGWNFQLPATKDVLEYKDGHKVRFYEWTENERSPVIWDMDSGEIPPVARRFLEECYQNYLWLV